MMNQQQFATYGHPSVQQQQMYAAARTNSGYGGQFATVGRTASMPMAGALPPISTWTPPSPQEHQYYDVLFSVADEEKHNAIGGRLAVMFFSRSSADKQILREIWNIADAQQRGELSRNEFYVAMRLISMAQHGEAVNVQRFFELAAAPFPLPVLEGVPPPPPQQQAPPHMAPQVAGAGFGASAAAPAIGGGGPHPRGPYAVTEEEKTRYDAIFAQYDTDGDGFLLGGEAVNLFQMSGLDRNLLREIWALADRGEDSKLDKNEFYVAMHLIVCASKRGLPVPPQLPQELVDSAFGMARGSFTASSSLAGVGGDFAGSTAPHSRNGSLHASAHEQPSGGDSDDPFAGLSPAPETPQTPARLGSFPSAEPQLASATAQMVASPPAATEHRGSFQMPSAMQQPTPTPPGSARGSFYSGSTAVPGQDLHSASFERANLSSTGSFSGPRGVPSHFDAGGMMSHHHGAIGPGVPGLQGHGGMMGGYGVVAAPPMTMPAAAVKPFLSDEDEVQAVRQLEEQNDEVAKCLAGIEKKQSAIEALAVKLRELDQLRHDLVALSIKRESVRAANSSAAASTSSTSASSSVSESPARLQAKLAVETSLQDLVASEKRTVERLQQDVAGLESELQKGDSASMSMGAAPAQSADFSFASGDVAKPSSSLASSSSSGFFAPAPSPASANFGAFGDFGTSPSTAAAVPTPSTASNPPTPSAAFDFAAPSPANSTSSAVGFDSFGDFGTKPAPSPATTSVSPSSNFDAFAGFGFS